MDDSGASNRGHAGGAAPALVPLIASGRATTRIELAKALGLAPSTVSLRVQDLINLGVLEEAGEVASNGGRRARRLRFIPEAACVLAAEVGGSHARLGIIDLSGAIRVTEDIAVDMGSGPDVCLTVIADRLKAMAAAEDFGPVRGVGMALPGPVDVDLGAITLPSRMPGWHGFPVSEWLAHRFGVRAFIDNDANLMALGEHFAQGKAMTDTVTVKAGTAIGSGIVLGGRLHRGATGFAGDITHVRVAAAAGVPCSCGNYGCLETIASGAALVRQLRESGVDISDTADVVRLAQQGEPLATTAVRTAGTHLGEALCMVVNFFNPSAVFLGGSLSEVRPYMAAVRSSLYEGCYPLATEKLTIARASSRRDAGLLGCGRLVLDEVFAT